jgi:alpha-beta hydrolase superfamily lysophospholipase
VDTPASALPRLFVRPGQAPVRAAVVLLHGGKADSRAPSRPWHLSAVRLQPFARTLAATLGGQGTVVATVGYRLRGWNGQEASPVDDARWAIERIEERYGPVPVVLLGHSMGGRAALRVAGHPQVTGVVALAPWLPPGEPIEQLAGRRVRLVHGTRDRWTNPAGSRDFTRRAQAAGLDVRLIELPGVGHFMLRRRRLWEGLGCSLVADLVADQTGATAGTNVEWTAPDPARPGR